MIKNYLTTEKLAPLLFALPAIVAALVFLPALQFDVAWDDAVWIRKAGTFHGDFLDWIIYAFTNNTVGSYYRPLTLVTLYYPAEAGPPTFSWHLTNVCLYVANLAMLGMLLLRIYRQTARDAACGQASILVGVSLAFFVALHPTQVETAAWISCRFELMSNAFLLALLLADHSGLSQNRKRVLIPLCFLLALLSKETALAFLPMYGLYHILAAGEGRPLATVIRHHLPTYLLMGLAALVMIAAFMTVSGQANIVSKTFLFPLYDSHASHARLILASLGYYVRLLLYPFIDLSPFYHQTGNTLISDPHLWLGITVIAAGIFAGWRWRRSIPLLLIALLAILPYLNWLQLSFTGNIVQNRYLYMPLFLLAISSYVFYLQKPVQASLKMPFLFFIAYMAMATFTTVSILPLWQHGLTLWSWVARENPDSVFAKNNLAHAYMAIGENRLAKEQLVLSASLHPTFNAHTGLAEILWTEGQPEAGMQHALMALESIHVSDEKVGFLLMMTRRAMSEGRPDLANWLIDHVPVYLRMTDDYRQAESEIQSILQQPASGNSR